MALRRRFDRDTYNDYLGLEEQPIIIGKYHWLVWVTPFVITTAIGLLDLSLGRNVRFIVFVGVLIVLYLKLVGPFRKWPWLAVLLLVTAVILLAELQDGFLTWLFAASLFFSAYRWLDHRWTTFVLTTGRIVRRSGILTTQTATMNLRALTDMRLEESIFGQLLNYGHFFVESAGQDQAFSELRFVPDPKHFYELIMTVALGKVPNRDLQRRLPPGWSFG